MGFKDVFKTYSPELRGDLEEYLRNCEEEGRDNLFLGPDYFFEIKDKGFMLPNVTMLRVDRSPIPDIAYFVNSEYLLESYGPGPRNMSFMGAEEGVYHPEKALKGEMWSISGLDIYYQF